MSLSAFSIMVLFGVAIIISLVMVQGAAFIGRRKGSKERLIPYECGLDPVGSSRRRMHLKFFLIAVLFVIFDVEIVFLYPWAVVFRDFVQEGRGVLMFVEMLVFLGILLLGFVYVWGRGALEWEDE